MKIATWSITKAGGISSLKITKSIGGDNYTLEKFKIPNTKNFTNLSQELEKSFFLYDAHIFIMATGIVIRTIAPFISTKDKDPAIVVVDENLTFSISLLSGHIGGANNLAKTLEERLGLTAIITTSSDITGKIAVDSLSEKLKCKMRSLEEAKRVTSLIVQGEPILLSLPKNIKVEKSVESNIENNNESENKRKNEIEANNEINLGKKNKNGYSGLIFVSNKAKVEVTQLYPQNIILGIGCRKGIEVEKVLLAIHKALDSVNISIKSLKHISSIELKKDEFALNEIARMFNIPFVIVEAEKIKLCNICFKGSDFVKNSVGVSSVSAPCAFLSSSQKGSFLLEKYICDGVTISIYEEED